MATFWSCCPGCLMQASVQSLAPKVGVPQWSTTMTCCNCSQAAWFVCCHVDCQIPAHKNVFLQLKQLRNHAQYWHTAGFQVHHQRTIVPRSIRPRPHCCSLTTLQASLSIQGHFLLPVAQERLITTTYLKHCVPVSTNLTKMKMSCGHTIMVVGPQFKLMSLHF